MQRIILSVTNDLTTDQRVHKVCTTLQKMGFDILLVGRKLENSIKLTRNYKTHRIDLFFNNGFLFYAEYNFRLFFYVLFKKKNILLANDLDTLLPNYLLSKFQNKKLIYDSHELFTEVPELIHRPKTQFVWLKIEKYILPKLKNTYTVCQSIADYYNKKYQTDFKVVRNIPKSKTQNLKPKTQNPKPKTIIYQGAVNIGRGLELMIDTMQYLENYLFIIVGNGDILEDLKRSVKNKNLKNKVQFLGKVTPKELKKITPKADLGLSIEEDLGLNYRYALPNKIFDYIHANIPILTSDLPEMKRIITNYQIGEVITDRDPKKLANQIKKILESNLKTIKENLIKAAKILQWKNEEKILQKLVNNLK
ncbi:MAG: glycosyltransferase [Flavobacteriaceae bacterium]|nr:glycosyltransferase [Flavobacteriaceae bacterium]